MTAKASLFAVTVGLGLVVVSGCPASPDVTASASQEPAQAAARAKGEAKPEVAAAGDPKAEAAGEHAGCIYAEGEKGDDPSCPGGGGEPEPPAASEGHFGAAFALADAVPLQEAVDKPGEEPVLVKGEVEAVCQKKGCWMVIRDGAVSARVMMKGHGFAVPMDARGKQALVEGTLTSRTFSEEQVKHLEKDGGGNPAEVSGTRTEHVLTATGVSIKNS